MKGYRLVLALVICGLFSGLHACSSAPEIATGLPLEKSSQTLDVDRLWKESFPGPITDIALASNTGSVLASSIPDPDAGGKYLLTLFSRKGKQLFQSVMKVPVKSIDLSADGTLAVVCHHEGELFALDEKGQEKWRVPASCKPLILNAAKKILCYHDDDTRATTAFEVFDFDGKKVTQYPIRSDILSLKVSKDEKWIALGLVGGKVQLVDASTFRLRKETKLKGEVLDVSVSNGDDPRVAVVSMAVTQGQLLSLYDADGELKASTKPIAHVEQVELLPSGRMVAAYGNSPKGQYVAMYPTHDLALGWQKLDERYADYSLAIQVGEDKVLVGYEESLPKSRRSRLLALDLDGKLRADIPLETAEGAYLYSFSYSPSASLLAVGTDDKTLKLYELK